MKCVARASSLRCAYCHDDLDMPSWSCARCATQLHEDCRELAGVCPILGCAPRFRLSIRPADERPHGASAWHLGAWFVTLLSIWATLIYVAPRVTKLFDRRIQALPVPTQVLCRLQHFAQSGRGIVTLALVVVLSILMFAKLRERPVVRHGLVALTSLSLMFFPFALMGVVLPLVNMAKV